jgi:hypothetical protein
LFFGEHNPYGVEALPTAFERKIDSYMRKLDDQG